MEEGKKEEAVLQERTEKIMSFIKIKYNWIVYVLLFCLVWFACWLRSLPMKINPSTGHPGLWDITTNNWTLGPDLDPFLFLRYTKNIVANHYVLPVMDYLRYSPLGFQTNKEYLLEPYAIAYFHKLVTFLGFSHSVEQSAVIFPVVVFALGVIAFFFFVRETFLEEFGALKSGIVALVASLFLIIIPALLPRTIAGIPDKQGSFIVFLFGGLYLFILSWKAKSLRSQIIFSILSAIITGLLGLYWGGYYILFVAVIPAVFVFYLLGKVDWKKTLNYGIWIFLILFMMNVFSPTRFSVSALFSSFYIGSALGLLFVLVVDIFYVKYFKDRVKFGQKLPIHIKIFNRFYTVSVYYCFLLAWSFLYFWNCC